ncbi:hypothetical protein FDZ74_16615 [bacterium]|nr:MAG: hypothetical protein FDZ74_16615 [bacterium]
MDNGYNDREVRRIKDPLILSMADWTEEQIPNGKFFTGTYSNEYSYKNGLHSDAAVLKDFEYGLRQAGFTGTYMVSLHDNGGEHIHVHAILEATSDADKLPYFWQRNRGGYQFGDATHGAYVYVAKHAMKTGKNGDCRYKENFH